MYCFCAGVETAITQPLQHKLFFTMNFFADLDRPELYPDFPPGNVKTRSGRGLWTKVSIGSGLRLIAVDGVHGKCRKADGDVLGPAFMGSGVTDPLAGMGDDSLSGGDIEGAGLCVLRGACP